MPWNPAEYDRYLTARAAPFDDLLALIHVRDGLRVIDLGCGTGDLTRRLAGALPGSDVLGVDSSAAMLARAAELARPGLLFAQAKIEAVTGQYDLVFSHSALQWVPDHAALVPRLLALVAPGGQLAVQLPSNHEQWPHRLLRAVAQSDPFAAALDGWVRPAPVLAIDDYAALLDAAGGIDITVLEKVYPVVLPGAGALLDWMAGTALVPYLERLPDALHERFKAAFHDRLAAAWPTGPIFYPFKRTLFAAFRP